MTPAGAPLFSSGAGPRARPPALARACAAAAAACGSPRARAPPLRARPRRASSSLLLLALALGLPSRAGGSNWAQVSGTVQSSVAWPAASTFSRRWGFAFAVVEPSAEEAAAAGGTPARLYVMGGDDYTRDVSSSLVASPDVNHGPTYVPPSFVDSPGGTGALKEPNAGYRTDSTGPLDTGGGDYRNDVWYSAGAAWAVTTDYRLRTPLGDPAPTIVSKATWTQTAGWGGMPPDFDGWRQYLACCHATAFFPCPYPSLCYDGDPFVLQRRWSPRRGHAAVTLYDPNHKAAPTIILIGGRARAYERMLGVDLNGGFLGDPFNTTTTPTVRHRSILTADVWTSTDGETWDYTNGGCYVPQLEHALAPGAPIQKCNTTLDCFRAGLGDAGCVDLPTLLRPTQRACVCNHFSPRERFAVAASAGNIYVSGGVVYQPSFLCGTFSCGTESARFADDVWASPDKGQTWTLLAARATSDTNAFGRADHALVRFALRWWIIGGRGVSERPGEAAVDVLYNDVHLSTDLVDWSANVTASAWSPRAGFRCVADPVTGAVYLLGGEQNYFIAASSTSALTPDQLTALAASNAPTNINRNLAAAQAVVYPGQSVNSLQLTLMSEAWVYYPDAATVQASPYYAGNGAQVWFPDYGTLQQPMYRYFWPAMPLTHPLVNLTAAELAAAAFFGAATVTDLSNLSPGQIAGFLDPTVKRRDPSLPPPFPRVCELFNRVAYLISLCTVGYVGYDDEWFRNSPLNLIQITPTAAPVPGTTGCEGAPYPDPLAAENDVVCRQGPLPRRSFGAGLLGGKLYVVGGWGGADYAFNDAWYRDDKPPVTSLPTVPADGTSDSVFEFDADEPSCVFELRAFDAASGALLRPWGRVGSPFDGSGLNAARRATRVEVRAVDPAGNKDGALTVGRNVHTWKYVPPLPVLAIVLGTLAGVAAILGSIVAYRRYQKRKALERYLAKRLARRLKEQEAVEAEMAAARARKAKRKKKKKKRRVDDDGEGGGGGAGGGAGGGESADMVSRFRSILRGRADRRVAVEFDLLAKRKSAAAELGAVADARRAAAAARAAADAAAAMTARAVEDRAAARRAEDDAMKTRLALAAAGGRPRGGEGEGGGPASPGGGAASPEPAGRGRSARFPSPAPDGGGGGAGGFASDASLPGVVRPGVRDETGPGFVVAAGRGPSSRGMPGSPPLGPAGAGGGAGGSAGGSAGGAGASSNRRVGWGDGTGASARGAAASPAAGARAARGGRAAVNDDDDEEDAVERALPGSLR